MSYQLVIRTLLILRRSKIKKKAKLSDMLKQKTRLLKVLSYKA